PKRFGWADEFLTKIYFESPRELIARYKEENLLHYITPQAYFTDLEYKVIVPINTDENPQIYLIYDNNITGDSQFDNNIINSIRRAYPSIIFERSGKR